MKEIWLLKLLNRSDITNTSLGNEDHIYIGDFNSKRKYKQRQYLLWFLRDVLSAANSNVGSEESFETGFGKELTFLQFYDFLKLHKGYTFNSNIPHISCLCEIYENYSLFAKGLNN